MQFKIICMMKQERKSAFTTAQVAHKLHARRQCVSNALQRLWKHNYVERDNKLNKVTHHNEFHYRLSKKI